MLISHPINLCVIIFGVFPFLKLYPILQSPLPEFYQKLLRERAQSANAVVGRRFYELEKQDLQQADILRGVHLANKMEGLLCVDRSKYFDKTTQHLCKTSSSIEIGDHERTKSRPITAIPVLTPKTPRPEPSSDVPGLCIRQLNVSENMNNSLTNVSNFGENRSASSRSKRFNEYRVHRPMTGYKEHEDKRERANSVREMRDAYNERIMSAPPWMSLEPDTGNASHEKQADEHIPPKTALMRTRRLKDDKSCTWKPLIYDKESDIKHSQGCPYQCKGCFKACLASEDYLERMEDKIQKQRHKQVRRSQPAPFFGNSRQMRVIKKPYPSDNFQAILGTQRLHDRVNMDLVKQHRE